MNLLDSVLCTSNAKEYLDNFNKFGINCFTLKLLSDDDLKIVGVDNEEIRAAILQNAANLQITAEKPVNVEINKQYIHLVLYQMSNQLTKHLATLSIIVNRKDISVCDIHLNPGTKCLRNCLNSLEKQLNTFSNKMVKKKPGTKRNILILSAITTLSSAILLVYKCHQYIPKLFSSETL